MRLYTPLLCAKCQGDRIWRSRFIAVFVSVRIEEENKKKKTKKLSQFLKSHISGTLEAISLKFGMWSAEVGGSVHSINRLVSSSSTELRRCENCVFFLPVNILTGVARRLLGPHDTLPCVLIPWAIVLCLIYIHTSLRAAGPRASAYIQAKHECPWYK